MLMAIARSLYAASSATTCSMLFLDSDPDVVAGPHPLGGEVVREPVRLVLQLGVGDPSLPHDEGGPLGDDVDGVLEEVSDVEGHDEQTRTRSCF